MPSAAQMKRRQAFLACRRFYWAGPVRQASRRNR
jgi:hypothetical protein